MMPARRRALRPTLALFGALLCLAQLATPASAGLVCKYKKYKGRAFTTPTNWIKAEDEADAKKKCDEKEECIGFHLYPIVNRWYLFRHGTELVAEPGLTEDFFAWTKRMLTCEDDAPKEAEEEEDEDDGEYEDATEDSGEDEL
mmetsp:Transcript_77153/g.195883  ORF Transcript_77153/g.195883 Transcript_77153/m.195883 type:complete len:143 (-) Transcript_77153:155-583(-)